jgi:hypothetical protein
VGSQQSGKLFVKFLQLRGDHVLTIGLVRIIGIVFLMIVFGFVEFPQGFQCGDDGLAKSS